MQHTKWKIHVMCVKILLVVIRYNIVLSSTEICTQLMYATISTDYFTSASSNSLFASDALKPENVWSPQLDDESPTWIITINDNDREINDVSFVVTNVETVTVIVKLPDEYDVVAPITVCTQFTLM